LKRKQQLQQQENDEAEKEDLEDDEDDEAQLNNFIGDDSDAWTFKGSVWLTASHSVATACSTVSATGTIEAWLWSEHGLLSDLMCLAQKRVGAINRTMLPLRGASAGTLDHTFLQQLRIRICDNATVMDKFSGMWNRRTSSPRSSVSRDRNSTAGFFNWRWANNSEFNSSSYPGSPSASQNQQQHRGTMNNNNNGSSASFDVVVDNNQSFALLSGIIPSTTTTAANNMNNNPASSTSTLIYPSTTSNTNSPSQQKNGRSNSQNNVQQAGWAASEFDIFGSQQQQTATAATTKETTSNSNEKQQQQQKKEQLVLHL
jgi:hypothetical protein